MMYSSVNILTVRPRLVLLTAGSAVQWLTFIMRMMVFIAIITIMKYSKGDETTRRQTRNLNELRFFGMYRHDGWALIAKSIHCFCKTQVWQTNHITTSRLLVPAAESSLGLLESAKSSLTTTGLRPRAVKSLTLKWHNLTKFRKI